MDTKDARSRVQWVTVNLMLFASVCRGRVSSRVLSAILFALFAAACSSMPTAPTSGPAGAVVATVSQTPPPVPPRLDPLPAPAALGATRFVAFGDSITYGTFSGFDNAFMYADSSQSYPARVQLSLRQIFPAQAAAFIVVNEGRPGERAVDGRQRIQSTITTYRPQGLLLLEGANDLLSGTRPEDAAAAVFGIIQVARVHNVTVLVGLMPQTYAAEYPSGETRPQAAEEIVPFNTALRRLVAGIQNVHIVDLYTAFGRNRSLMGNDGLHPTAAGYEVMASKFVQAIETVFPVRGSVQ